MTPTGSMYNGLLRLRDLGFDPTGILDVGAYEGHFSRGAREIFKDARILMIEALQEKDEILKNVSMEIGNAEHAIMLIGDCDKEDVPFFVVDTQTRPDLIKTGSSKFRENADFPTESRLLKQHRLENILDNVGTPFQFLKLDVQGAELEVLRSLGHRLSVVEMVLMELSLVNYNEGAPIIDNVLPRLAEMGFVLYDIVEDHRDSAGHLLQIDGIFVRPSSVFRPQPPFWS